MDQAHLRRGYGCAAVRLLFRLYGEIYGVAALRLAVAAGNAATRAWHLGLGFSPTDQRHFGDEVPVKPLVPRHR